MSVSSIGGSTPPVPHPATQPVPQVQKTQDDGDGDTDSGKESQVSQATESQQTSPQPGAPGHTLNILA